MKLVFVHASSAREAWADQAWALYKKKVSHFFPISEECIFGKKVGRDDSEFKKRVETEAFLAFIRSDDFVFLFDENGERVNSREFSKRLEQALGSSKKRIVFIIGGAFGVDEVLRRRADRTMSLGPLTYNHLLAKVVGVEQVYRALTILRGIPYHND